MTRHDVTAPHDPPPSRRAGADAELDTGPDTGFDAALGTDRDVTLVFLRHRG